MELINTIKVNIIKTSGVSDSVVDACVSFFRPYIAIKVENLNISKFDLDDYFDWEDCFSYTNKIRIEKNIDDQDFLILLTDKSNSRNWFAGFDDENNIRNIFIQTSDWNNFIYANDTYLIIYEIMAVVFQSLMAESNGNKYSFAHSEPIGCLNDFCGWKPDIQFKVKSADICKVCLESLEGIVSEGVLKESIDILNKVREKIIASSKYFDPPSYESTFFSPIALTKRKITTNNDPLRKTLFAIDHFDLLIKTHIYFSLSLDFDAPDIDDFLSLNELNRRPSLGHWVRALSNLSKKQKNGYNSLRIHNLTSDILSVSERSNIVKIRNEERGHGYINCQDHSYRSTYGSLNVALNKIEDLIVNAFNKYILVRGQRCSKKASNNYDISINILTGSNMLLEEKITNLNFNPDFIDGYLYLVSKDLKEWSCLHPYFIFNNCPTCNFPRLMVKDGEQYIDIFEGHRVGVSGEEKI